MATKHPVVLRVQKRNNEFAKGVIRTGSLTKYTAKGKANRTKLAHSLKQTRSR